MKDDNAALYQILKKQQLIQDLLIQNNSDFEGIIVTQKEELALLIEKHGVFSPLEVITLLSGIEEVAKVLAKKVNLYGIQDASQYSEPDSGVFILHGEDRRTYERLKLTDSSKAVRFYKEKKAKYYASVQRVEGTKRDFSKTAQMTERQSMKLKAKEIWVTWKTEKPDLYKNQTRYIEDMINKRFAGTEKTVYRWLREWKKEY